MWWGQNIDVEFSEDIPAFRFPEYKTVYSPNGSIDFNQILYIEIFVIFINSKLGSNRTISKKRIIIPSKSVPAMLMKN